MIDFVTKSVNSRMVTAFFDTREEAQTAADSLKLLGVRSAQIQIAEGSDPQNTDTAAEPGFWETLKNMFLPAEDHHSYAEGLKRGGFLVSANVEPELYDRALEIVESGGAVDMDEREQNWRSSGWQGYQSEPSTAAGSAVGAAAGMATEPAITPLAPIEADGGNAHYDTTQFARDTSHGRKGLRSYTMVTPIQGEGPLTEDDTYAGDGFSPSEDAGLIAEHMDVIASEGTKIGTVDHLDGDRIKLAKSTSPDGQHHFIPLAFIDHVDAHVHLKKSASEARASW